MVKIRRKYYSLEGWGTVDPHRLISHQAGEMARYMMTNKDQEITK